MSVNVPWVIFKDSSFRPISHHDVTDVTVYTDGRNILKIDPSKKLIKEAKIQSALYTVIPDKVAEVIEVGMIGGRYYMYQSMIHGTTFREFRESRSIRSKVDSELIQEVIEKNRNLALEIILCGYLHHDFHEKNLLKDDRNNSFVIDFGLTIPIDESLCYRMYDCYIRILPPDIDQNTFTAVLMRDLPKLKETSHAVQWAIIILAHLYRDNKCTKYGCFTLFMPVWFPYSDEEARRKMHITCHGNQLTSINFSSLSHECEQFDPTLLTRKRTLITLPKLSLNTPEFKIDSQKSVSFPSEKQREAHEKAQRAHEEAQRQAHEEAQRQAHEEAQRAHEEAQQPHAVVAKTHNIYVWVRDAQGVIRTGKVVSISGNTFTCFFSDGNNFNMGPHHVSIESIILNYYVRVKMDDGTTQLAQVQGINIDFTYNIKYVINGEVEQNVHPNSIEFYVLFNRDGISYWAQIIGINENSTYILTVKPSDEIVTVRFEECTIIMDKYQLNVGKQFQANGETYSILNFSAPNFSVRRDSTLEVLDVDASIVTPHIISGGKRKRRKTKRKKSNRKRKTRK